ncbi:MAG: helix-hairpin-helix domain-containing protein [Chloroflexota bacterium]|nr:helix-hairpin-helix domain-containing protein [Chloroflexota bacterium]
MTEMKDTLVDVNIGSQEELITVPGIGKSLADRIIEKRPYKTLDNLVTVSGINKIKLSSLLPYLTLEAKQKKSVPSKKTPQREKDSTREPISTLGTTEAFVFLEDRNERQDALLMIFGGFILGLIILLIRRKSK